MLYWNVSLGLKFVRTSSFDSFFTLSPLYTHVSRKVISISEISAVNFMVTQPGHSINDVQLIPLELIRSKRDSVRKAREAHLINKAKTLHPLGINRRDETRQ